MKKEIADFVSRCLNCQKVKAERCKSKGLVQPLEIPQGKWDSISMDFVGGLPMTHSGKDKIWVIVDRLTKTARLIAMKETWSMTQLTKAYVSQLPLKHSNGTEARYGQKCRSPLCWENLVNPVMLGPQYLHDTAEKIKYIQGRMKMAQDRQKSYADLGRKPAEFLVGEKVWLKVSPTRGVMRFGKKGKLSPRFIGPYEILERIGNLAYRLALPMELERVHNVFHVSQLKKYVYDPSHVIPPEVVPLDGTMSYEERPIRILDSKTR
ncbi:PREDICTED: uncharacterized protein LOC109192134 [Ipomoea nil]|uniref:uncharacterized protein LOC109192134 n=1 Tax=Ipomoea nil TaxID=35883 RepID=UPI000900AB17|nr:PREDICTED: uncharacterized protein LOC109192134 [Ipomoea nil]